MTDATETDMPTVVAMSESLLSLGSEVRQLRKARQMTLKDLSHASGISLSHLSAVERGTKQPSVRLVYAIAHALEVSADWFFARRAGTGPMERAFVVRARNRRDLNSLYGQQETELGYRDALLSSSIGGAFYMGLAVYPPRSKRPEAGYHSHKGEQHGLIIKGELELTIGDEVIRLATGDSYSFDARTPHHGRNVSDTECHLVWAVSPVVIPKHVRLRSATGKAGNRMHRP